MMKKIPTVFLRDHTTDASRKYVTAELNPVCDWVFRGEGRPTRKYNGVCMMFDGERWLSRREVKSGKLAPEGFIESDLDPQTNKRFGWEPAEQSVYWKYIQEALNAAIPFLDMNVFIRTPIANATYELIGPKVSGNPEGIGRHMLVRHGYTAFVEEAELAKLSVSNVAFCEHYDVWGKWLREHDWEGIVWHHPDGRRAKLKARDFSSDAK